MCILGAVFVEDVVVQPLTEFIWTGNPANDGLKSVARCFNALCSGIQTLQTFYSELKLTRMPNGQRMFPFPCSYLDSQNHTVDFQYTGRLSDTKLVYLAKNKANGEILCEVCPAVQRDGTQTSRKNRSRSAALTLFGGGKRAI